MKIFFNPINSRTEEVNRSKNDCNNQQNPNHYNSIFYKKIITQWNYRITQMNNLSFYFLLFQSQLSIHHLFKNILQVIHTNYDIYRSRMFQNGSRYNGLIQNCIRNESRILFEFNFPQRKSRFF